MSIAAAATFHALRDVGHAVEEVDADGTVCCAASAIRAPCALGIVEITEAGRAGNREFRTPNKFRLTYQPVDRAKETDEWARIQTIEQAEAIAKAARAARKPRRRKQVYSGGSRTLSVAESATENAD